MQRNRAKRLLREAARVLSWPVGTDVVLVARPATAATDLVSIQSDLDELRERAGWL